VRYVAEPQELAEPHGKQDKFREPDGKY
jgi:hypothetical protein